MWIRDLRRQLGQRRDLRFARVELEQRPVELEQ
jgi:hypothetical protein